MLKAFQRPIIPCCNPVLISCFCSLLFFSLVYDYDFI
uniref:Uncharacterized protein n=1 Tax=Anguilla anguilla TaxID=7936 RepID=A0A0E9PCX1_ANGAN